jgi:cold shock CspA family protein/ribosome-associated translation inhibitor RaiA
MQIPLEISFHGVSRSDWSERYIREQADRLEQFCDNIISCRVSVEQPHRHHHNGNPYRVRVEVRIPPNKDLVATEEPVTVNKDKESHLQPVIHAAFQAMERQLKKLVELRRNKTQRIGPEGQPQGLVVRLFPEGGYGFIRTAIGEECYFHQNSVLHDDFKRLAVGTEVRFVFEMGEMGPQASSVQIINKPGVRESDDTASRSDVPPGWRNV